MPYHVLGELSAASELQGGRGAWVRQLGGGYIFEGDGTLGRDADIRSQNYDDVLGKGWRLRGNTHGFFYYRTLYYTSSGSFSKGFYPGLRAVRVKVQGGGGGSGAVDSTGSGKVASAGGGGGGGYAEALVLASALSATETVTVGAGGAAGVSSTSGGLNGSSGRASAFGSHCQGRRRQAVGSGFLIPYHRLGAR